MIGMFLMVMLAVMGVWVWSLVDVFGRPGHQWQAIGQDRTLWALAIVFLGLPGSIAYLALVRPKLIRAGVLPPMMGFPMLSAAPAGWYPDPQGMQVMRWFDGRQWTPQTAPMGSVPMGGTPVQTYGAQPMPMSSPMVVPPAGAPPQNYPYPPA